MNKLKFIILITFLYSYVHSDDSKFNPKLESFDVMIDARSVALGEINIANPNRINSFAFNPATLIGVKGLNFYYNSRDMNWNDQYTKDIRYYSIGILLESRYGYFGLNYSYKNNGTVIVTSVENLEGIGKMKVYNYTFSFSYANYIKSNLSVGLNIKTFDYNYKNIEGDVPDQNTKNAFVGDFGVLYYFKGFINQLALKDKIYIGASIQNIGTDFKWKSELSNEYNNYSFPIYLSIGCTYHIMSITEKGDSTFQFLIYGEFQKFLNPSIYQKSYTNFGGIGFEAIFYDIVSLRLGGIYLPYTNIYGNGNRLSMRYGIGLFFPLKLLGIDYPINFSFDFAHIPTNESVFLYVRKKNLLVFNIHLNFEKTTL